MSEWWTYRLGDLLMFSPRTYARLFERYNADVWPLHVVTMLIGAAILFLLIRRQRPRTIAAFLAILWLWIAYAFLWQRYSTIFPYAKWFAVMFVVEAALLIAASVLPTPARVLPSPARVLPSPPSVIPSEARDPVAQRRPPSILGIPRSARDDTGGLRRSWFAWGLFAFALFVQPLLFGRPWQVFGIAPDPTVVATIAALAAMPRRAVLLIIPIVWVLVSGATLWTMAAT